MGYHKKEKLRISKATHQTNFQMLMKKVKNYNFANNTCEIFFQSHPHERKICITPNKIKQQIFFNLISTTKTIINADTSSWAIKHDISSHYTLTRNWLSKWICLKMNLGSLYLLKKNWHKIFCTLLSCLPINIPDWQTKITEPR